MSKYMLTDAVLAMSKATKWNIAKFEWDVVAIVEVNEAETCICGHYPIRKVCIIKNSVNGNSARIGKCCAKKFMKKKDSAIIRVVERIREDNSKSPNVTLIDLAFKKKWINKWEWEFSMSTEGRRKLSIKQQAMREKINKKILAKMSYVA